MPSCPMFMRVLPIYMTQQYYLGTVAGRDKELGCNPFQSLR